jgi:hypothetical protein
VGDRAEFGNACANLGICYISLGLCRKAIELHEEHKKIAEEVGDRSGVGTACGSLGICYESMGQYGKAIALHEEHKQIAEEVGNPAEVARACCDLCRSYSRDGKLDQALTYGNQSYEISREVQLRNEEVLAAYAMGTVLVIALRADRRGHAAEASLGQASDEGVCGASHTPSSLSEGMNGRAEEAERWLHIALERGWLQTHLQLSRLYVDTGREEEALTHLQFYLLWCVERARGICEGCRQARDEDVQMLTCGGTRVCLPPTVSPYTPPVHSSLSFGCRKRQKRHHPFCLLLCCARAQMLTLSLLFGTRKGCGVARFCSVECQKMASHIGTEGEIELGSARHKDMCGLLKKWRQFQKGREAADSLPPDMLAFLRL